MPTTERLQALDLDAVMDIAREHMGDSKAQPFREQGYILHHGLRTAKLSMQIIASLDEQPRLPENVIFAGAVFHDVGKGHPAHNEAGANMVADILTCACSPEQIEAIAMLVRAHNERDADGHRMEAKVIQDADILDHFGGQNVWLSFHWSANKEDPPERTLEYYYGDKNSRYIEWCRSALHYELSREEFERRLAFEREFFARFSEELDPS